MIWEGLCLCVQRIAAVWVVVGLRVGVDVHVHVHVVEWVVYEQVEGVEWPRGGGRRGDVLLGPAKEALLDRRAELH
jgi:hypothetical protein